MSKRNPSVLLEIAELMPQLPLLKVPGLSLQGRLSLVIAHASLRIRTQPMQIPLYTTPKEANTGLTE